jgi:RNA polymerase sigma factor (sigma-70 family)
MPQRVLPTNEELQAAREAVTRWHRVRYRALRDWVALRLRAVPPAFKAEDIVQEALARLWEGIVSGRVACSVWGTENRLDCWLRHTCEHIISECRRKARRVLSTVPQLPVGEQEETLAEDARPGGLSLYQMSELSRWLGQQLYSPPVEEALETEHTEAILRKVQENVRYLPELHRTVVLHRYWEAKPWKEIAGELGLSLRSLYRRHREALGMLHCRLASGV